MSDNLRSATTTAALSALICALSLSQVSLGTPTQTKGPASVPNLVAIPSTSCKIEEQAKTPTIKLQGKAELAVSGDPLVQSWMASQLYRQGAAALDARQFKQAAKYFEEAANRFNMAVGPSKFTGEAQFAQAQCLRLMGQKAEAAQLFQASCDMLKKHDPTNPFIPAGIQYLEKLPPPTKKAPPKLQAQLPRVDVNIIDKAVSLKGLATKFENGTSISALRDQEFFGGTQMIPGMAEVDLSDSYVKKNLLKAFTNMNCLETAALGANYTNVTENYKPFTANGKTVAAGASGDFWAPVARLKINGKDYGITMALPGLHRYSKNVMIVTDGRTVLAIDPRTSDTWKLLTNFKKKRPEFDWWRMTHIKKVSK